ncbi:hypothetical protein BCR34DRAFT_590737 [Clohesyomyces aquaticus]|uniref:Uncharacterized protein n=1 Tax=Clohesyomyces aquaticus TaxID=1231657 RepID=A0A1Y1Z6Z6_9PLEO|nr:hypothetical protein BCR34DRAFT_590737 [Clohesyomyces aquaticus]
MRALALIAFTLQPLAFAHPLFPSHIEAPTNPNIIVNATCEQYVVTHPETELCAELTNSKDCSGPTTVIVGTQCLDIKGAGSISVIRGSVFAGHGYVGCQGNPVFFAGKMYHEQQQGCQSWGRSTVLSWRAG